MPHTSFTKAKHLCLPLKVLAVPMTPWPSGPAEKTIDDSSFNGGFGAQRRPARDKEVVSFDYAGNGNWPKSDVINLINQYSAHASYFFYKGKRLGGP
jgi:hypothetical protein